MLPESGELSVAIPSISDYLNKKEHTNGQAVIEPEVKVAAAPVVVEKPKPDILLPNAHMTLLEEITDRSANREPDLRKP